MVSVFFHVWQLIESKHPGNIEAEFDVGIMIETRGLVRKIILCKQRSANPASIAYVVTLST